jgi:hypothetical protein
MGFITTIIGVIILVIIVAIILLIIYVYFIDKGAIICGIDGIGNSIIFGSLCKCPDADGKDPNGDCYTCPTINGVKTVRTAQAVTASNACAASLTPILSSNCTDLYGAGTDTNGQCYTCPSGYDTDIFNPGKCGPKWSIFSTDIVDATSLGPSSTPATITKSVLF